jgi:uncharacterized protein
MVEPPINDIVRQIVAAFRPRRIVMFGSRATGTNGPDSDLDLMIEMETSAPPLERVRMVDRLLGLRRWAMDLVVFTPEEVAEQRQYRNSLLQVIEAEGRLLYEQPG